MRYNVSYVFEWGEVIESNSPGPKRFLLGADCGGPVDDFVESVTLYVFSNKKELAGQVRKLGWAPIGEIMFKEVSTKEEGIEVLGFFNEEIDGDSDCWRASVDKSMRKYKKVIGSGDFDLGFHDLFKLTEDELDELEEEE